MASLLASVVQRSAWRSWSRLQSYSTAGGVNKGILDVRKKKETSVEEVKPEDLVSMHMYTCTCSSDNTRSNVHGTCSA